VGGDSPKKGQMFLKENRREKSWGEKIWETFLPWRWMQQVPPSFYRLPTEIYTQPPVQWVPGFLPGYRRPGCDVDHPPHLVSRSWKSTAIPVLPLWARVACYRVKPYLTLLYGTIWHQNPPE
jgi:hypothetical protein